MKNTNHGDFQNFYLELPPIDYLNDIEIQDEYEVSSDSESKGLSDEQVSQIALDSLRDARAIKDQRAAEEPPSSTED